MNKFVALAKGYCPVKTGTLRKSIRILSISKKGYAGEAGTDVSYAPIVEFGARPHEIVRHMKDGRIQTLYHPGFEGKYFMTKAAAILKRGGI